METMVSAPWDGWTGRRVFITGHTGFKGSWLALWLTQLGASVCGYALEPGESSLFESARVAERITDLRGDICNSYCLQPAIAHYAPEIVFHLAAQPLVRRSYAEPALTYATNVMGTVQVLEAVRRAKSVRAVVCITTDKCYENREWPWGYRELDRLGGHDPYSSSKACAELVCSAYRDSFFSSSQQEGVALATARAGNVIGGGDWAPDRLIPDLLRSFELGVCAKIRNPQAIRPWQHVLEPLRGYLALGQRLLNGESTFCSAWNFGPEEEDARPVAAIADQLAIDWSKLNRRPAAWSPDPGSHVHEANYLKLDCSKAHGQLHWRPKLGLLRALELIVEWTHHWKAGEQAGADMQRFSLDQIAAYQQLCQDSLSDGFIGASFDEVPRNNSLDTVQAGK